MENSGYTLGCFDHFKTGKLAEIKKDENIRILKTCFIEWNYPMMRF